MMRKLFRNAKGRFMQADDYIGDLMAIAAAAVNIQRHHKRTTINPADIPDVHDQTINDLGRAEHEAMWADFRAAERLTTTE